MMIPVSHVSRTRGSDCALQTTSPCERLPCFLMVFFCGFPYGTEGAFSSYKRAAPLSVTKGTEGRNFGLRGRNRPFGRGGSLYTTTNLGGNLREKVLPPELRHSCLPSPSLRRHSLISPGQISASPGIFLQRVLFTVTEKPSLSEKTFMRRRSAPDPPALKW
jgi:hypothetical protein